MSLERDLEPGWVADERDVSLGCLILSRGVGSNGWLTQTSVASLGTLQCL